ncbi:MAG: hypothetical protein AAGF71_00920 [Pseudomonadota bacterium]
MGELCSLRWGLCLAILLAPVAAIACEPPPPEVRACLGSDLIRAYELGVTYGQMDLPRSPPASVETNEQVNCFVVGYALAGVFTICDEAVQDFLEEEPFAPSLER